MAGKIKVGDTAYIVESNRFIKRVTIMQLSGEFCVIRMPEGGAIRVRANRLFQTEEEAKESGVRK